MIGAASAYRRDMAADPTRDFTTLPPPVKLDETIVSIDTDLVPDPGAGRNVEQHRALRDD